MADYSKQYCDKYDMGFEGDFDIDEEFENLMPGYYTQIICEGYGFAALHKSEDGINYCVFFDKNDKTHLVPYSKLTGQTYYQLN